MSAFFKQDNVIIDVDGGNIVEIITGKVMTLDLVNMTMKSFTTKTKLTPIRFSNDNKNLLMWEPIRSKWVPFKDKFPSNVVTAVAKLIEAKIEKELIG